MIRPPPNGALPPRLAPPRPPLKSAVSRRWRSRTIASRSAGPLSLSDRHGLPLSPSSQAIASDFFSNGTAWQLEVASQLLPSPRCQLHFQGRDPLRVHGFTSHGVPAEQLR